MDVHVHFLVRQIEKKQNEGENSRRHDVAVRLADRVQQQPVADQPAVHKNINPVAVRALHFRPRSEPAHPQRSGPLFRFERRLGNGAAHGPFGRRNLRQLVERLPSKDLIDALG